MSEWYEITKGNPGLDPEAEVVAVVEAKNKWDALAVAQDTFGGLTHTSGFIRYLLSPEHGALYARKERKS